MSAATVEAVLGSFDAFDAHDLDGAVGPLADDCAWTEHATGTTHAGSGAIKDWFASFFTAFPDLAVSQLTVYDAGDAVVATFTLTGTNDGPLGPLPTTGRQATWCVCDVFRFDGRPLAVAGETFYDQLSLLAQLGHAESAAI